MKLKKIKSFQIKSLFMKQGMMFTFIEIIELKRKDITLEFMIQKGKNTGVNR